MDKTGAMERLMKILSNKCQNCFKYRKSVGVQVNFDANRKQETGMDKVAIHFGVQCNLSDDNPQKVSNSFKGEMEQTTNIGKCTNDSALGNNIDESDTYHTCEKNDDNSQYFKQLCLQVLCNVDIISNIVGVLYKSEGLEDFVSLVTQLSNGTLSPKNIAFLLLLDRVHLNSCATTTAMHFCPETHQFWEVVFRICPWERFMSVFRIKKSRITSK